MKPSFIAQCLIGAGGSYAYRGTIDDAVKACGRILIEDWGHLFTLDDGRKIKFAIYDVTDIPNGTDMAHGEDGIFAKIDDLKFSKIAGYFPTPRAVVEKMIDRSNAKDGDSILDPQAGSGGILDVVRDHLPNTAISAVEINPSLCEILDLKGYNPRQTDFLEMIDRLEASESGITELQMVDVVLMNPPFERGQDMDHIRAAYKLVRDGGRLVAIMSPSFLFKTDKKTTAFKAWLDELPHFSKKLPSGSFKESGTGVETTMLVIEV